MFEFILELIVPVWTDFVCATKENIDASIILHIFNVDFVGYSYLLVLGARVPDRIRL